ncbi:MAG: HAMP domain-containing protein [Kutzneria sp.]|nr:HAMP domain-containing protein [Kutzneria sp.]
MTLAAGVVVISLTYLLVQSRLPGKIGAIVIAELPACRSDLGLPCPAATSSPTDKMLPLTKTSSFSDALLNELLVDSVLSLAVMVVVAIGLGWWMAGRAPRPVHRMTASARRISANNLHERIALDGPADELKELADTFDALLGRLDAAFDSQRRFIANAAHELRTPLAISRATLQIELEEPPQDPDKIVAVRDQLLTVNRRSEHLIDSLLLLATSDRGLTRRESVDMAELVTNVVRDLATTAENRDVTVETEIRPLTTLGDPVLLCHLVTNLVHNAIRHNLQGGTVAVCADSTGLTVTNTGPTVPEEAVPALFEPFRRLHADRVRSDGGAGLGLSIVRSIVEAHGGALHARPNPDGGLSVRCVFGRGDSAGAGQPESSGTSQITPAGGSCSTAEAGRPCHGAAVASTSPRLPQPEPP